MLLGARLKSLGPRERGIVVHLRASDRGGAKGLTTLSGADGIVTRAELIQTFIISGEADDVLESIAYTSKRAASRVQSQAMYENVISILRHVGKDIEEGLTVVDIVGKQRIIVSRPGKGILPEENIEQADANSPDVCRCGGIASCSGRVELLRSHVTITANAVFVGPVFGGS